MRSQRGFALACALTGTLALAGSAAADTDIQGNQNGLPDIEVKGTIAPTKAQRARARPRRRGLEPVRHAVIARRPRRHARRDRRGRQRRRAARAWLRAQQGALQAELDGRPRARERLRARGAPTHAVSLRQTVGGLPASGGGLVTIGVTKAGGGWRIVSATSTVNGDETLAGKPSSRPSAPGRRRRANVGLVACARADPPPRSAKLRLRGWRSLQGRRPCRRPAGPHGRVPDRRHGYVPAYETIVLDTSGERADGLPRVRRRPQRQGPRAREHGRPRGRPAAASRPDVRLQRRRCRRRRRPATSSKGPYTVAAGSGVRAIDTTANADTRQRHRPATCTTAPRGRSSRTPARRPSASATRPPAASRPGDYFVRGLRLRRRERRPWTAPLTYTGTLPIDDSPPPTPYLARWEPVPGEPAAERAATPTRGTTRAPTRARSGAGGRARPPATATA